MSENIFVFKAEMSGFDSVAYVIDCFMNTFIMFLKFRFSLLPDLSVSVWKLEKC